MRDEINNRYDNTFMSRLANDGTVDDADGNPVPCGRTPIVIIMQRVHDMDLVGYLLRGNSSDKYDYLNIPAVLEKDTGSKRWYDKIIDNSLFATYYFGYLSNLFNTKNRLTKIKAYFPIGLVTSLRLNDRLVIQDKRYIINSFNSDITTGEVSLELINDFRKVIQ